MEIIVSSGKGSGPTKLAAFDAALAEAGVSNYNLIYLSSVIPPNSKVSIQEDSKAGLPGLSGEWGDRLYVVVAEQRESVAGKEAWAGIGWVQDESGKGLFVEHHADNEQQVRQDIKASLGALVSTRGADFGEVQMKITGTICQGQPVCALVVAVYESNRWQTVAES